VKTNIHFLSYLARFYLEWDNSDNLYTKNQNTNFILNNSFFFRKSWRLWDNLEKYFRAGRATDDKMAHAHCVLHN